MPKKTAICALLVCAVASGTTFSQEPIDEPEDARAPTESGVVDTEAAEAETSSEAETKEPVLEKPQIELSPELADLRDRVRRCMAYYFHRPETTLQRSPWGVMHSVVGFGVDTPLRTRTKEVNAISWLCGNAPCNGLRLLYVEGDQLGLRMGPGYQGHKGQFLCILAQSRVKIDYPIWIGEHRMTVADLVEHEQMTCESGTELTFKLIGLSHYLEPEATWRNQHDEPWSIERLIKEELAQPVLDACCGGTHRMTGFSYAVKKRAKRGKPMTGQWYRAKKYVDDYHVYTVKLQNPDGSFSTNWFRGRADSGDIDRKLNTTGHTLEWLVYSLPKDQLTDPRVIKAVTFLSDLMWEHRGREWEIGPKGHAVHALALYDEYVFGGKPGKRSDQLAEYDSQQQSSEQSDQWASSPSTVVSPTRLQSTPHSTAP